MVKIVSQPQESSINQMYWKHIYKTLYVLVASYKASVDGIFFFLHETKETST